MDLMEELEWRGLLADCTDRATLAARLQDGPLTLYCGFDPTADSLHVGNLVPLLALRRFQQHGHRPIAVAGGATGMIGDPSGKSNERVLQTPAQVAHNIAGQTAQMRRFLEFDAARLPQGNVARVLNNADWTAAVTLLDFLRDVGKHFSVNVMTAKDSVRARLESEAGISFTEFSYMLLQAYDFCHLRASAGCELQVGATDQWGNITAGTDLIRKKLGATAWGLTFPLLVKPDGTKYGKTAEGAVWLDARRTSPYRFYQYFVQIDDAEVIKLLRILTFLPPDEIGALEAALGADPSARAPQKALARELTLLVHGPEALDGAIRATEILFGAPLDGITPAQFQVLLAEVPTREFVPAPGPEGAAALTLVDALVLAGLAPSRGQARKDIEGGGVYLNNRRIAETAYQVAETDWLLGKNLLLRKGKRNYAAVTRAA